ncbi:HAMP domain-containing histidine kinase [Paenibacillus oenotherae]|uniref:histidine kinase n=1 Tax=Paenibacillus oenotherae TaxID=1435645 RepID=A0ABS7D248_9BACL|nr:HAMP domain-containing sensor histidine kinase [Paenibacillus oenotherae]MBW7473919.1 HAMP domain-containing histidine kinase [Paenibacillus oenotherae]
MTRWRHSVAFRLFAITFVVIMLFLGVLLTVLAGSFSSFYERRQIKDIEQELNLLRDQYKSSSSSLATDGFPPYFFQFENDYYATISLVTMANNKVLVQRAKQDVPEDSQENGWPPMLPYGPDEQTRKFMSALQEWQKDSHAVDQVMNQSMTLVYRSHGNSSLNSASDQLLAVAPIETDGHGGGTLLFATSSLQPVIGAAKVIRDFSWYAFGVAFVFVPVLAFLYAGILTRPLRSLNELAGRLASLDFSVRIQWRRKDEIGELARTFDFLADNLQGALAELHEANDKLREDIEREKALERIRRDFIAGVSHELKTPLSLIGGYAEGLQDNIGTGAKRERYVEVILDETRRMSAIVGDMLDLSQLESGQYRLNLEPFDAAELLKESAARADALGAERHVLVKVSVPPADEDGIVEVLADRFRIGQVLTNLVTNAVRHTPDKGTVTLAAARDGAEWRFTVHNEGDPIAEEELPRIWSQFYRVDKARARESGGTGIGLAIVKQILDLHGSRYDVRNEQGGVMFAFTLQVNR